MNLKPSSGPGAEAWARRFALASRLERAGQRNSSGSGRRWRRLRGRDDGHCSRQGWRLRAFTPLTRSKHQRQGQANRAGSHGRFLAKPRQTAQVLAAAPRTETKRERQLGRRGGNTSSCRWVSFLCRLRAKWNRLKFRDLTEAKQSLISNLKCSVFRKGNDRET